MSTHVVEVQSATPTFIIARTGKGFRVYSPDDPDAIFLVSGGPDFAVCDCREFEASKGWSCPHIEAVLRKTTGNGSAKIVEPAADKPPRTRLARQPKVASAEHHGIAEMVLKRSVSPDGRIDSLSVELSCAVDKATEEEIVSRALLALRLQGDVVTGFLTPNGHKSRPALDAPVTSEPEHGQEARLLRIEGMDGRYGRRLFITVQVNGSRLRFFGSRKELSKAIETAGFAERARTVEENLELNLPCRVITEPSADGRFVNVKQVMPAGNGGDRMRA